MVFPASIRIAFFPIEYCGSQVFSTAAISSVTEVPANVTFMKWKGRYVCLYFYLFTGFEGLSSAAPCHCLLCAKPKSLSFCIIEPADKNSVPRK